MIERVTGGRALPSKVVEQVATKTDGVPLFVEELTKSIVESDLVRAVNSHYELTGPLSTFAIPSTLHDSLMARLDRLPTAKEVAQLGATIGREFSYELLQAVSPLEGKSLQHSLQQLVEAELVYQRGVLPQAHFLFKHALIQDTAYQSLLKSIRQQYHRRIAQVLEEQFPETVGTQPELVAQHYTEAGVAEQAIGYWHKAGQRARQRSANTEAERHLSTGIRLLMTLPDTPERAQQELTLQLALGPVLMATKSIGHADIESTYSRARALCQQLGDTPQLFPAVWGVRRVYVMRAKYKTARELEEQLFRLAQNAQDPGLLLEVEWAWGTTSFWLGELTIAHERYDHSLSLYDIQQHRSHAFQYGTDPGMSASSYNALTLWHLGYPDQAVQESLKSRSLARDVAHPLSIAFSLFVSAWVHYLRQAVATAQTQAEATIRFATEQEFPHWVALSGMIHGWSLAVQGDGATGIAQLCQSLSAMRALGGNVADTFHLAMLAEAYCRNGQLTAGQRALTEALELVDKNGERAYAAELYRLQGELFLRGCPETDFMREKC
jgi:predicted ATPase